MDNNQRHTPSAMGESPTSQVFPPTLRSFGPHGGYDYGNYPGEYGRQRPAFASPTSGYGTPSFYNNNELHNGSPLNQEFYPQDPYNNRPYQFDPSFDAGSQEVGSHIPYGSVPRNAGTFNGLAGPNRFGISPPQGAEIPQYADDAHSQFEDHPSNPGDGVYDEGSENHYPDPDPDYQEDRQSEDDGSEYDGDDGGGDDVDVKAPGDLNFSYGVDANSYTSYRSIIRDEAHYNIKKDERRNNDTRNKKPGGLGFPMNENDKLDWVRKLFDAIKNMDGVYDQRGKGGKEPQAVVRIKNGFYDDEHIEKVCWSLLVSLIQSKLV
jgi:hypothetical protein